MVPTTSTARTDLEEPDLAAAASVFTEHLGWPVSFDVARKRLVVRTGDLFDALRLRQPLAEPVALDLASHLMTGPVCIDSHGWWTFITEPCQRHTMDLPHDLRAHRVHAVPSGGELVLPPVAATASWWQQPEPDRQPPPWTAVVAIARQVLNRGR